MNETQESEKQQVASTLHSRSDELMPQMVVFNGIIKLKYSVNVSRACQRFPRPSWAFKVRLMAVATATDVILLMSAPKTGLACVSIILLGLESWHGQDTQWCAHARWRPSR